MEKLKINNLSEIENTARQFLSVISEKYPESRCIIFNAGMGVGKTTFIKALCKVLGAKDEVSSPTFSIVNDYLCNDNRHIFHFDLYRLKDLEEAMAAGAEDYIYGNDYCLIEWPEILAPILPENTIEVDINEEADGSRTITIH
ncbi:MAG: tRNA (adenosine(37)-N6)-threonylcarbamoyltransferase complex ATPase subunit type 1 TsaE [Bacteroidales bacterium]|nr:tRNA (adenosine(37)-N6)-threonylcarbamoyltransferase complex ATPase subunit type 1 TsaE [Bacteroidales bacterium]